ncbi:MAG: hypothetical protein ACLS7Q_07095 [Varibaculum cambriense]
MANPVMNQVGEQMRRTPAGYPEMPWYQVGGTRSRLIPHIPSPPLPVAIRKLLLTKASK